MKILFTVTNDLSYDQRMHRICGALAQAGHAVTLVGRHLPQSIPLKTRTFQQKRLPCFFKKGFLFYAEFNLRLFFYLLTTPCDAVCSIDLDTLAAGCFATVLRGKKRVFDAHEYFTEVPEVVNRPLVKGFWAMVARLCLPFYRHAYTVGPALAEIFEAKYGLKFGVVRNVPSQATATFIPLADRPKFGRKRIFYQGALNEGRGIEAMLEAMQHLENVEFVLAGEGDLSQILRQKAQDLGLEGRVTFLGFVQPEDLKKWTSEAWLGLNLLENKGLSYYYSLANKFFDQVQAGVPVITMDFPEYRALNSVFGVAILLPDLAPQALANKIQDLMQNEALYERLYENCLEARQIWNWEIEQKALLEIWQNALK